MPTTLRALERYTDAAGNVVEYDGHKPHDRVDIQFAGRDNRLVVHPDAQFKRLSIRFDCDHGLVELGSNPSRSVELSIRVGQDATVTLGDRLTTTSVLIVSAVEGATVTVGDDVMFASANQLRADDGHPIFDVRTGQRVNPARDITIGDHVWMGREACALGGASVGSGSVIGFRSLVTGPIPNNVVAAGIPARVLRTDIAWERPHLSLAEPYYKPDASTVKRTAPYWALTETDPVPGTPMVKGSPQRRTAKPNPFLAATRAFRAAMRAR